MTEPNLKSQIVDIINNFLQDNKLVDARTCEGEFLGMHSSLTVGGAHEVVEELEKLIAQQAKEARIEELTISRDRFVPGWEKDWFDDRIAELKGDDK
jgi:hypothetical protein